MSHQNVEKTMIKNSSKSQCQHQQNVISQQNQNLNKNKTHKNGIKTSRINQNNTNSGLENGIKNNNNRSQLKTNQKYQDLDQRSTLEDIQKFVHDLLTKSQTSQNYKLSLSTKFLLSGYIDILIKESNHFYEIKDNSALTPDRLRVQWFNICGVWKLYEKKASMCIGEKNVHKMNRLKNNFEMLDLEMQKVQKNKQKLEQTRKSIKKFYADLIN